MSAVASGSQRVAPRGDIHGASHSVNGVIGGTAGLAEGDVQLYDAVTAVAQVQSVNEGAGGGEDAVAPFYTADASQLDGVGCVYHGAVKGKVENMDGVSDGDSNGSVGSVRLLRDAPVERAASRLMIGLDFVAGINLAESHRQAYDSRNQERLIQTAICLP